MLDILKRLVRAGAERIAIPCNTAHHWHEALSRESPVPIFHMGLELARVLAGSGIRCAALFATAGTLKSGTYAQVLETSGVALLAVSQTMQADVSTAISLVKAGELARAGERLSAACDSARSAGAERIILGCTELPLALREMRPSWGEWCIDPTEILARACIEWSLGVTARA
jgi:aspartate racemase